MARKQRATRAESRARNAAVDDPAVVLAAAARFLEVRPRSVDEVRRRLGDAGYRGDLVEGALERLLALGYLDDSAFARTWVESRDRARPRGAHALRVELRRKGLAGGVIEDALAAREAATAGDDPDDPRRDVEEGVRASSEASDREAAERLLERRGSALLREPDPRRRRAKAYALLARNGFGPDVCREAASAWLTGVTGTDE
jgi:regulatory protein